MSTARPAIVVGAFDYGESDRILTLLTPADGRVRVLARRARASKKRFAGLLDLGTELRAQISRGRGDLSVLSDAERVRGPDRARQAWDRLPWLFYGCEVCSALAPESAEATKLFKLLQTWLALLEEAAPSLASGWALEAKALTFAGLAPGLVRCAECGEPIDDPAMFSVAAGGALHARCGGGRPVGVEALHALEALRRTPLADTVTSSPPDLPRGLLADAIEAQLSRRLESRAFLSTVQATGR
ncbi:MAG: DNA repair protein RecO [Myxococcota bacterium]